MLLTIHFYQTTSMCDIISMELVNEALHRMLVSIGLIMRSDQSNLDTATRFKDLWWDTRPNKV
ncbi:hypothetical protein GCM10027422_44560 [Hymenobacter arcticus]